VEAISKFNGECHRAAVALRISSFSHGLYPFSHELGRFNENLVFYTIAFLPAESDQFIHYTVAMDRFLR
ncbi:hypothetical protein N4G37_14210, partial [Enterococcus faecalis]|nr:hypothetical protein [Enterococcus faecalis]